MHMKLDELIRSLQQARTHLVHMEGFTDEELEVLQKEFQQPRLAGSYGLPNCFRRLRGRDSCLLALYKVPANVCRC